MARLGRCCIRYRASCASSKILPELVLSFAQREGPSNRMFQKRVDQHPNESIQNGRSTFWVCGFLWVPGYPWWSFYNGPDLPFLAKKNRWAERRCRGAPLGPVECPTAFLSPAPGLLPHFRPGVSKRQTQSGRKRSAPPTKTHLEVTQETNHQPEVSWVARSAKRPQLTQEESDSSFYRGPGAHFKVLSGAGGIQTPQSDNSIRDRFFEGTFLDVRNQQIPSLKRLASDLSWVLQQRGWNKGTNFFLQPTVSTWRIFQAPRDIFPSGLGCCNDPPAKFLTF